MDAEEYRRASHEMVDFIIDYHKTIRERPVLPKLEPGYLKSLIPSEAPEEPESWDAVMADIERVIMSGVTHWHSPNFHAYFPTANSYPALLADMLCGAIGCIGFTWNASPACTELEVVMMDWLGKLIGLPDEFLACSGGKGGGVIQGTASEATLVALLTAKAKTVQTLLEEDPTKSKAEITHKLVAYACDQAHSSVQRAGLLAGVTVRLLESDESFALRGETLNEAIKADLQEGLIPFYVVATLGATPTCSFDNLREIGHVCRSFGVWVHVDAAYAGSSFVCEEFRCKMDGIELTDSFNFNPHKWLLVNFDCSAMWIKDSTHLVNAFNVDPLYLKHEKQGLVPDYRHWQIPLGRRFRSLKLWFVMRLYGRKGLQDYIRKHVSLAKEFEAMVSSDSRFELVAPASLGLVCFRLKGSNDLNDALTKAINAAGTIHLVPSKEKGIYFLRFAVCSSYTESEDIHVAWVAIEKEASLLLGRKSPHIEDNKNEHLLCE